MIEQMEDDQRRKGLSQINLNKIIDILIRGHEIRISTHFSYEIACETIQSFQEIHSHVIHFCETIEECLLLIY